MQMKKYLLGILAVLLLVGTSFADFVVPTDKITGAEEPIPLGELVVLKVETTGAKPADLSSASYTWKVYEASPDVKHVLHEKKFLSNSDSIFFGAGTKNKTLVAVCTGTYLYIQKDATGKITTIATKTVIYTQDVIIGEVAPVPPPAPPVPPTPISFDDGKYKLAQFSYDTANNSVKSDENRGKTATALANSFAVTAAAISAGTLKGDQNILTQTKSSNNLVMNTLSSTAVSDWNSFFLTLQDKIYSLYSAGNMDYATAWREISNGLSKVK